MMQQHCNVPGCNGLGHYDKKRGKRYFNHGYCSKHYQAWRRNGDPLAFVKLRDGRMSHPLYKTWRGLRHKVTHANKNPRLACYKDVKVCERWCGPEGFNHFVEDMGEKPEGYTIDRIDPYGDYSQRIADGQTQSPRQTTNVVNVLLAVELLYPPFLSVLRYLHKANKILTLEKSYDL